MTSRLKYDIQVEKRSSMVFEKKKKKKKRKKEKKTNERKKEIDPINWNDREISETSLWAYL